jgi:hypothetical protein
MARKGLNKKSLQNGMDQSSMDAGLVSDVQTMLNMGSSVEDVIVTLANEGYETDTITGLLMNVGYTGDDITTAFSSLQQQQQQASQQVEKVQGSVDDLPQQQFGGSSSYRTADQFMRGVEGSDYYADPYSRFLPMNLFSRNSPVSLLPFVSTAVGSLFGGKDRDGDGLMDGVFRDRKAKKNINKDRFGKDRRNEKQLAKDLAKYSTIDFDAATGEYDINLLSRDPERYLSKNKKVRDAYLENAAQSDITLEDFVKRFSKNKPSAQALLDYRKGLQSGDIPEGTSYGISPEGVESSYMDMGDNPYLYDTMMGLNTLRNQNQSSDVDDVFIDSRDSKSPVDFIQAVNLYNELRPDVNDDEISGGLNPFIAAMADPRNQNTLGLDEYQDQGEFNGPVDFPKTGVSIARVKQEKGTLTPQQEMMLGVSPGKYQPIIDWEARRENKDYNKQLKASKKAANTPDLKYTYMYDQGTMTDNIEDFPLKGFDVGIPADSGNVNRKRLTNQVESWLSKEDRDPSKFTFTPSYDTDAEVGTPEYQNYIDMLKGRASDLGINVDWTKQKTGGESLDIYQFGDEVTNALQQFMQSYPDTNKLQSQFSEAGTMDWADTLDIQNQVSANQRAASAQGLPRQDQADTFSFRNAFATGAMDKMQDYYDGLEGLANEDELAALLPEAENFDPGMPMGPMTVYPGLDDEMVDETMDETVDETVDESGLTRKQKRALRREEKGTLGERINAKGNKFLDRMIDGRFGDVASTIGTIGVEGANIFNQFAENAKLIQAREDLKTLGSSERKGVSYREEDQGTDVNTGLRADLLRGSTPTGTQALMGNFKSGGESLNASSSVIAKLIAAGADIEIL